MEIDIDGKRVQVIKYKEDGFMTFIARSDEPLNSLELKHLQRWCRWDPEIFGFENPHFDFKKGSYFAKWRCNLKAKGSKN